jgi:hypothetical protein
VAAIGGNISQQIQPNREILLRRFEINHVIRPPRRDVVQQLHRQIAVRIDQPDAFPGLDVLQKHVTYSVDLPDPVLPMM